MDSTAYIALSHMTALRRQMDMIANNIANASTPSYKAEKPLFTDFYFRTVNGEKVAYVEDFGTVRNLDVGTITATGNPLDLAINGPGYYIIETPEGDKYTRNGQFMLSPDGALVTREGHPLIGDGGEIVIPEGTANITVSTDGVVSADGLQVGRLIPVYFEFERDLKKLPNGMYETDQQPIELEQYEIRQGMVEASNVQTVIEMTHMIDVSRAYQNAKSFIEKEDERVRMAIRQLSGNN